MALDRTAGYDMLVQVSEAEINNQLATAFLAGLLFPGSMSVPISSGGVTGTADINLNTPVADLDRPRPQMGITLPFSGSQLDITAPVPLTVAPLGGTIVIVDAVAMVTQGTNQLAVMDFASTAPSVTVTFDASSAALLAPLLAVAGLTLAQAQNMMAGVVLTQLQTSVGQLALTPPIPVIDDTDPTTIFDIDVTTVNDTSTLDRDCLAFGVKMANDSGGNINGVTQSFIPAGSTSMVMMSNFWLLAKVMRPRVATALGIPLNALDTPLRLNRSVPAPGGQGTLTNLSARVDGNRIRVDGRATDSGTGWDAESNFTFFIDIALSGGAITVNASTPSVDTDVDLEWWVWLVSLGLGAVFGGIVGAIVAAIVLAVVEAVAEGIANNLVSSGIGGALGGLGSIPLGPIGGGLTMTSLVLDDLELRGSIIRSVSVPVKNHGEHESAGPFALDLDSGQVGSVVLPASDLVWNPTGGLSANGAAGLSVTGAHYGSLTPIMLSQMPLTGTLIAAALVPFSIDLPFFGLTDSVVFGVRTGEGRLAKCRAWRSLLVGGTFHLEWTTYDNPIPQLDIASRWSITERGDETEYITRDCSYCRSTPVARCGVFEAWPRLMTFPVDYEWCLCGTVLEEGEGVVNSRHGPLAYRLNGRRLVVQSELGQEIDCELCVSAIDARGHELFTCTRLSQPGVATKCRKCTPRTGYVVEMVAARSELAAWRPIPTGVQSVT